MADGRRRLRRNSSAWALAFRGFLEENGISDTDAARAIGVTRPAVISWATERSTPGAVNSKKVERWTGGRVPESLLTDDAGIDNVQPFRGVVS